MLPSLILTAKVLHVVGFVSWFAGLFYLGRVLVNHADTQNLPLATERDRIRREVLHEEYVATAGRVYRIICNPAHIITWVAGLTMVALNPGYLQSGTPGWLWVKIGLVVLLTGYQHGTKARIVRPMAEGQFPYSDWQLRLWNEVPTFFLLAIPALASFGKVGQLNYWYLLAGVSIFGLMVYRGAVAYRKKRLGA